jgi:hypothetical protein
VALSPTTPAPPRSAVAGYTTTAVLSSLIEAATAVWQVAVLRAGAWAARGLRVPARNALLADIVPATGNSFLKPTGQKFCPYLEMRVGR